MPATTVLLQADDKMPAPKVESRDSAPTNKSDPGITSYSFSVLPQADDNIPATKPNSQSSPEEWLFYQVAPGNITCFESCSNFLSVITDHAGRSDMSSSDPTLATYNSVKYSDNFQQFKFLIDSLLSYQNSSIYDNFDKWSKSIVHFDFSSGFSKWMKFLSILWNLDSTQNQLIASGGVLRSSALKLYTLIYYPSSFRGSVRIHRIRV